MYQLTLERWYDKLVDFCLGRSPRDHYAIDHLDQLNPVDIILVDICGSGKEWKILMVFFLVLIPMSVHSG